MAVLRISESQAERWQTIFAAGDGTFDSLRDALCKQRQPSIRASVLFDFVKRTSDDEVFARAFCTEMIGLATFRRRRQRELSVVLDQLIGGMEQSLEAEIVDFFEVRREKLRDLLSCDAIRLPAKALDLTTDQSVVFYSGNLVTDIRPVFDVSRNLVKGSIVTHSMKLHYFEDAGRSSEKVLSMALDSEDIDNLISELNLAKQKAEACRSFASSNGKTEVFIVGEETYDFG